MANFEKTKALILRATKYSEADLILQVLTVAGERLSLLARGALKSKKRFGGGVLEPTHYVEISIRRAFSQDRLSILEEATLLEDFKGIRQDYDRLEAAFYVLEVLSKVSQEGDVLSDGLFDLAGNALRSLQEAKDLKIFLLHFGLKILNQQGMLEPENWMQAFLKTPLAHHKALPADLDPQKNLHWNWVENQLKEYLAH
jgi:DNA repair protein RecO (recombination protein O)